MVQAELLPFLRIVDYLRQLCAQGRSGTVFLVSDDNRMAQVRLDKGKIASMLCRNRRGVEALGIMRSMANARLRFDESFLVKDEHDNLSTEAIFDALAGSFAGVEAAPPALPRAAATAGMALTPALKATIERVMTGYIGPMAQIICEDHFAAAGNLQALVQLLADEIGVPAQVVKFRADIARELGLAA
jgi:hypothetical protein